MAALRAAVFPESAKNRRGGHFLPPPPPVRVLRCVNFRIYIFFPFWVKFVGQEGGGIVHAKL